MVVRVPSPVLSRARPGRGGGLMTLAFATLSSR